MTAPLSVFSSEFFMHLLNPLPTDDMMICLSVKSKKPLFEHISAYAESLTKMPARAVFDALIKRKQLGSAYSGDSIATPRVVLAELSKNVMIITTLETDVTFGAHDKKPVDVVCTILDPDQANCDHLKLVSAMAKNLANGVICQALRSTKTASVIRNCFAQHHATTE